MNHTPTLRSHIDQNTPPIVNSRRATQDSRPGSSAGRNVASYATSMTLDELLNEIQRLRKAGDVSRETNKLQDAFTYYSEARRMILVEVLGNLQMRRDLSASEIADLEQIASTIKGWLKQAGPSLQKPPPPWNLNSPDTPPWSFVEDDGDDMSTRYKASNMKPRTDSINHSRQRSDGMREKGKDREVFESTAGERERMAAREIRKERKELDQSGWADAKRKRDKERGRDRRSKLASLHGSFDEADAALGDTEAVDFSAADAGRHSSSKDSLGPGVPVPPLTPAKTPERMAAAPTTDPPHDDAPIHTPQSPVMRARSLRTDSRYQSRRNSDHSSFDADGSVLNPPYPPAGSTLRERAISNARRSTSTNVDVRGDDLFLDGRPAVSSPVYQNNFTDTPKAGNGILLEESSRSRHSLPNVHTRAADRRAYTEPTPGSSTGMSSGNTTPRARSPSRGQTMPARLPSDDANTIKVSPVNKVWNDVPGLRSPPLAGAFPNGVGRKKSMPLYSSTNTTPLNGRRSNASGGSGPSSAPSSSNAAAAGPKEKRFAYPHEASPYDDSSDKSHPFSSNSLPRDIQTPPTDALLFKSTPGTSGRSSSFDAQPASRAPFPQPSFSKSNQNMSQAELDALPPWKRPVAVQLPPRAPPQHPAPPPQPPPNTHGSALRSHTQSDAFGYPQRVPFVQPADVQSSRIAKKKRPVHLPRAYMTEFLNVAERNTRANHETVGLLLGSWESDAYYVSVLLIPPQVSTYRCAIITRDTAVREYQTDLKLTVLGIIHYHIGDDEDALLSDTFNSVDLHRLCRYQSILPEAFAIGIRRGPTKTGTEYVMRALTPDALRAIQMCRKGADDIHWHGSDQELFEDPNRQENLEHVHHADGPFKSLDLR